MKRFVCRTALGLLAVIVMTAVGAAAEEPWDKAAFSVPAQELLRAAEGVKADKPEPATILLMERRYVFDEAGRMNASRHMIYRVNTPSAVEGWSSVGTQWEPWHQKQPVVRARVITPDGQEHSLDPKTLTDAPAHENTPQTYGDARVYHGPLPAVAAGAVVEEEVATEETEPFFSGGRTERVQFQNNVLRHRQRIVIDAPVALGLRYTSVLLPNLKIERQENAGRVLLTFAQSEMLAKDSVDPMLPSDAPRWPYVEFSTGKSWQAVAASYAQLAEPQIRQDQVKAFIANAKKKGQSRQELIAELVARLHKEIRYTGLEFGQARLTPQTPAEVLQRKYGDCKDKAAMLVAMLRASGIPAHLALLNTDDDDRDITQESPGMGQFNHAIVYVPGEQDLWIDATAEFVPVGELPWQDQGRMALIVRDNTTGLVRTPECTAAGNISLEKREFAMSDYGPARVVETAEPTGAFAVSYRADYADPDTKERRNAIERYVKAAYLADTFSAMEHSESHDLSKPFHLRIDIGRAKRGYTDLHDASAAILPSWIVSNLPEYFRQEEDKDAKDKPERTADFEMWAAAAWEWQYRIVPPAGFKVRALPENKSQNMGPARFTQEYKVGDDGVVTARLRLAVQKRRFTAAEGKALRQGVLELQKADVILLNFEHEGFRLLSDGKGPAGLQVYRTMAAQHPQQALHQARLAEAHLLLGLGESARNAARKAVELEPKSALAHKMLGQVLEFDLIGRRYKKGFDPGGAAAEYRKAIELDPKDDTLPPMLAGILEFNRDGERYGPGAKLDEAIAVLRGIREKDKDRQGADEPLSWDLMFARRFEELKTELAKGGNANRNWMKLVATAATTGPAAAIEESRRLISAEQERTAALNQAGVQLMRLRMYPQAAELVSAATAGQPVNGQTMPLADLLRRMKRHEDIPFRDDDPKDLVLKAMATGLVGDPAKVRELMLLHDSTEEEELKNDLKQRDSIQLSAAKAGYPLHVLMDLILAGMVIRQEGDDSTGYRLNMQAMGAENSSDYVVKQNGRYLLLETSKQSLASLGKEALAQLEKGNMAGARRWLDWARDQQKLTGGDDPLAGPVFPRFWTKGQDADAETIRTAALALIAPSKAIAEHLPALEQARDKVMGNAERVNFDLLLATAYMAAERWDSLRQTGEKLLKSYPTSDAALYMTGMAYGKLNQWSAWDAALQERAKRTPDDKSVVQMRAMFYEQQGQHEKAREVWRPLLDSGRAGSVELNSYAWDALFTGKVTQEDVEIAQRAAAQAKNYPVLHTLACLYADTGKLNEARQMLLEAMEAGGLNEPNGSIWYGIGRIAEQYGEVQTATAAYARVEKPQPAEPLAVSSYALAELHTKQIASKGKPQGAAGK